MYKNSQKIQKGQEEQMMPLFRGFGVKESNEIVILVIKGQH